MCKACNGKREYNGEPCIACARAAEHEYQVAKGIEATQPLLQLDNSQLSHSKILLPRLPVPAIAPELSHPVGSHSSRRMPDDHPMQSEHSTVRSHQGLVSAPLGSSVLRVRALAGDTG